MPQNPLTLKTLAQSLDLSISTISRALSGKKGVSEKQRRTITALADKMGIRPDAGASFLRLGRRTGLSIVIPASPPEISVIRNNLLMSRAAEAFGSTSVYVHQPGHNLDETLRLAVSKKCEAVILSGVLDRPSADTALLLKTQRVALTVLDGTSTDFDYIEFRRDSGTYQAARLFFLSGRKHIHFLSISGIDKPDPRLQGILAACDSLNIPRSSLHLHRIDRFNIEDGYQTARTLLSQSPMDALFCYNDVMALGALKALQEQKLKVPEDVALIGFSNLPFTAYLSVPLTTVSMPMEEAVDAAFRLTQERLKEFDRKPVRICFPCHLVARQSAPIPDPASAEKIFEELK